MDNVLIVDITCRVWRTVAERSKFWLRAQLMVDRENFTEVVESRKINLVPEIIFSPVMCLTTEQLTAIYKMVVQSRPVRLKQVNLSQNDHRSVPPDLVASAVTRLERVGMYQCQLSPGHLTSLYKLVGCRGPGTLRELIISRNDHSAVPADLLATALTRLEKVKMFRCNLSPGQLQAVFIKLAAAQGALHHLDLGGHNMTLVPAELLVEAISRLESVMLSSRSLTMDQLIVLYQMVAERRSVALRELVVSRNVHCAVPSDILATALIRLVKVDMFYCNLSAEQLQTLFSKIATNAETSTLRYLDVSFSKASLVPVEVLTGALVTLEAVMLQGCCLTLDQLEALYSMVAERRSGRLVELRVVNNNTGSVSQSLRDEAELNTEVRIQI